MSTIISFTILGLFTGAAYAIAASGLVLTYTTTRVFNIAHGAFGMVMAFTFWDLSQRQGMPTWLALILVLGVIAPGTGWLVQRFVTRGLGEGPVSVSLVVTVGLFVGLIGLAQYIWPPAPRTVPPFLPDKGLQIGDTYVTAHQIITIVLSVVVAAMLYLLLNRTRIGTAMRASVDNPVLLQLFGGKPDRVASLSWAIGISLAALAGILLSPVVGLVLLRAHAAGDQRVRRRDVRPAQEPAVDLRRRDGPRACSSPSRSPTCPARAAWPASARWCRRCSCSW